MNLLFTQTSQGIIGANPGNEYNISGVAYDADLSAYRVFGCSGSTSDDGRSLFFLLSHGTLKNDVAQSFLMLCSVQPVMTMTF